MAGKERHLFPGNNTPEGFFSYYHYILNQHEAEKIYCLKGGPGTGKSTFMRNIGSQFLEDGEDVDFFHCSSDRNSIDGILLKKKKIAMVDGTAPHVIDPVNPGAVDTIIHLGEFWNEQEIRKLKHEVITSNERVGAIFARVYNYLRAAGAMYDNLRGVYGERVRKEEIHKIGARIIHEEMSHKEISSVRGRMKKFFASAITPQGIVNELPSLVSGYKRIYVIETMTGLEAESLLSAVAESAVNRGFDVEAYYCPIKPAEKIEHLLCPDLDVAFITSNEYHSWGDEVKNSIEEGDGTEVILIDLIECARGEVSSAQAEIQRESHQQMEALLAQAVHCLAEAKKEHDLLESYYISNMDFGAMQAFQMEIQDEIKRI